MDFLQHAYGQSTWLNFLAEKFNFHKHLVRVEIDNNEVESFQKLGFVTSADNKQLSVYEIHISNPKLN